MLEEDKDNKRSVSFVPLIKGLGEGVEEEVQSVVVPKTMMRSIRNFFVNHKNALITISVILSFGALLSFALWCIMPVLLLPEMKRCADATDMWDDPIMSTADSGICYFETDYGKAVDCRLGSATNGTVKFNKPMVTGDIMLTTGYDRIFGWTQTGYEKLKVTITKGMECDHIEKSVLRLESLKTATDCYYDDSRKCFHSQLWARCFVNGPLRLKFPASSNVNYIHQPVIRGNLAYTRYTDATPYPRTETVKAGERAALLGMTIFGKEYICTM